MKKGVTRGNKGVGDNSGLSSPNTPPAVAGVFSGPLAAESDESSAFAPVGLFTCADASEATAASAEIVEGHDAWTVDRALRRSTPAPFRPSFNPPAKEQSVGDMNGVESALRFPPVPTNLGSGKAMDLVERSSGSEPYFEPLEEMEELYALGDFSDALRIAELILGNQPGNEQARRCANNSRRQLENLFCSKIGPLNQAPTVAMGGSDLRWLGLDHRAGFVLSRIDGKVSIEELFDLCGMSKLEVLQTMIELLNCGAVVLQKK